MSQIDYYHHVSSQLRRSEGPDAELLVRPEALLYARGKTNVAKLPARDFEAFGYDS